MALSLKNLLETFVLPKIQIMENKKVRSWIRALVVPGAVIFLIACNGNSDYTKNSAAKETPASNDTTVSNTPSNRDTTMNTTSTRKESSTTKKGTSGRKGKITVGTMTSRKTSEMKPDNNGVYEVAEVNPVYPGGRDALQSYINQNIEYPQSAIDNNSEGTVDVQFVVDENGKVTDVKAIGSQLSNDLQNEAVRTVSNMPKWTPGSVKGKNVKTKVVLPITFKMEEQ